MDLRPTEIPDVVEIVPKRFGDSRGWFSEVFKRDLLVESGIDIDWIQDNESFSATPGTLRGLHYQVAPVAQDKLVRVLRGSVLDVAVDIRRSSPTFGQHVTRTLSAEHGNQLLVPAGFAHGFVTLVDDVHVAYKVSAPYSPECERSIAWDDASLKIDWKIDGERAPVLSDKDLAAPRIADQPDLF